MKRDVMRLGEFKLISRYTNLIEKQKEEEEIMQKMLMNESTTSGSKNTKIISKRGLL